MKRRELIQLGMALIAARVLHVQPANAGGDSGKTGAKAKGPKITEKDILRDGQPTTIPSYCEHPEKQPNAACPGYQDRPGHCETCQFFNKDDSLTEFKGKKYARCELLIMDPTKPQFVLTGAWCATFVEKIQF